MIAWSDIRAKYDLIEGEEETAVAGFKRRKVELFETHRGEETDEIVRGKPVTVNVKSFARNMKIPYATFLRWTHQFGVSTPDSPADIPDGPACVNEGIPSKEGFLREINERLRAVLPHLRHLSPATHILIAEDLAETLNLLDQIKDQLKVSL